MVRGRGVAIVLQIRRGQHRNDAGRFAHGRQVETLQIARRDGAEAKSQMQRAARGGDVVDVARGTGDMEFRSIMGKGLMCSLNPL